MQTETDESGVRYQHPTNIQREIAGLPPLGSEEFWTKAQAAKDDADGQFAAETLVYCLRQFSANGDAAAARRVAGLLLPRCGPTILKHARKWFGKSDEDQEDMRQEVHYQLWKELRDPTERFWEVRFYLALKRLCYDVAKRLSRQSEREQAWPQYVDEQGNLTEREFEDTHVIRPDERVFVEQALGRLEEPLRTAMYLRVVEEWPIHSQDRSALTISGVLGVTDRTVRYYISRARKQLEEWYAEGEAEHAAQE